jgi:N-acetylneuraminic acid mutarotase
MRKGALVLALCLGAALLLGVPGCSGNTDTTTTVTAISTTLAPTTTTTEVVTTTTTEAPGAWSQLVPKNADDGLPGARFASTLAYVPSTSSLLMFGGWDGTQCFNAVLSYDPAADTWTDLDSAGITPAGRTLHSMCYVPSQSLLVVFGGYDGTRYLGDTWAYDIATDSWTDLAPIGDAPAARGGQSLVYLESENKLLLFGGWNGAKEFGDTWEYDLTANSWTELRPDGAAPAARDSQAMVYMPESGNVLLFGGWNQSADFSDTWAYDPSTNAWTNLEPAGDSPSSRALHQMVLETSTGKVLLVGGGSLGNVATNDAWAYDPAANAWAPVASAGERPATRTGHAMAYDEAAGSSFLFGGSDGGQFFNDLWTFSR